VCFFGSQCSCSYLRSTPVRRRLWSRRPNSCCSRCNRRCLGDPRSNFHAPDRAGRSSRRVKVEGPRTERIVTAWSMQASVSQYYRLSSRWRRRAGMLATTGDVDRFEMWLWVTEPDRDLCDSISLCHSSSVERDSTCHEKRRNACSSGYVTYARTTSLRCCLSMSVISLINHSARQHLM